MKRISFCILMGITWSAGAQNIEAIISSLGSDRKIADTLFHYSKRLLMRGKNDSADYWLDRGLVHAQKTGDPTIIASYYIDKSSVAFNTGNTEKSFSCLRKVSGYLDKTNSYDVHNKYLLLLAKCHRAAVKYDSALVYYKLCEKLNEEKNPYRNWLVYLDMAMMFGEVNAVDKAENYFSKAYAITKQKGIRMDHGVVVSQFSDFCQEHNMHEKFADLLKDYQEFTSRSTMDYTKDPAHSLIFIDWGNKTLEKKVYFLNNVKEELLKRKDYINAAVTNSYIYILYERNNQPDEALKYIEESLDMVKGINYIYHVYIYTRAKYRVLKNAGRSKEATAVADNLFALKDSILSIQNRELALTLEKKFESEKKEAEIALLKSRHELNRLELKAEMANREALQRENNLKEEKLAKEYLLRMALERENELVESSLANQEQLNLALARESDSRKSELQKEKLLSTALVRENELKQESLDKDRKNKRTLWAGMALLALSGLTIGWQYRRQVKKNNIIKQQADEMEVLNREIHHRVKNNLQVISSLLDIQSQTIKDPEAADVIRESRQRVQSMTFIHQNLYEGKTVGEIGLSDYINNLANHLFSSYNIKNDRIRFRTEIEKIRLHTDTVIPLGMILNELISNSLKYAFKDLEEGEIKVALKQNADHLFMEVKDNGKGLPPNFDINALQSFGFKVIRAFAQKLKAKLLINGEHGTNVQLVISKFKTI